MPQVWEDGVFLGRGQVRGSQVAQAMLQVHQVQQDNGHVRCMSHVVFSKLVVYYCILAGILDVVFSKLVYTSQYTRCSIQ